MNNGIKVNEQKTTTILTVMFFQIISAMTVTLPYQYITRFRVINYDVLCPSECVLISFNTINYNNLTVAVMD